MKKQIIRLTESDLHKIIKKSVNKILRESGHEWWREEDWNPNHPDYVNAEDELEDEPDDFDERYYNR